MRLNNLTKKLTVVGRWMTTTLFCLVAMAFVWQGTFFSSNVAVAASNLDSVLVADLGNAVKNKVDRDADRAKDFVKDTTGKVKGAAEDNTDKVKNATDNDSTGKAIEGKAKDDKEFVKKRANEDSARTQDAVDNTRDAVKGAVDNIKNVFSK